MSVVVHGLTWVVVAPCLTDYDETGSKKQPRLTKQQADILQTKYFEWGGTLRNVSERELAELSQTHSLKVSSITTE